MNNLLSRWPIPSPWTIRPQTGGINNDTRFVKTPAGSYILRIYGATRDLAKIHFELAVMAELSWQGLSFAVPAPMPSRSGDPIVLTESGAPATLAPVIPGVPAERGSLPQAYPIGAALGELTEAFARVHVQAPPGWRGTYGDLAPCTTCGHWTWPWPWPPGAGDAGIRAPSGRCLKPSAVATSAA